MCRSLPFPFLLFVFLACCHTVVGYPSGLLRPRSSSTSSFNLGNGPMTATGPQAGDIIEQDGQKYLVTRVDGLTVTTHDVDSHERAKRDKRKYLNMSLLTEVKGVPEVVIFVPRSIQLSKPYTRLHPQAVVDSALSNVNKWSESIDEGFEINRTPKEGDAVWCRSGQKEPFKYLVLLAEYGNIFVRLLKLEPATYSGISLGERVPGYLFTLINSSNNGDVTIGKQICRVKGKISVYEIEALKGHLLPLYAAWRRSHPPPTIAPLEGRPDAVPAAGGSISTSCSTSIPATPHADWLIPLTAEEGLEGKIVESEDQRLFIIVRTNDKQQGLSALAEIDLDLPGSHVVNLGNNRHASVRSQFPCLFPLPSPVYVYKYFQVEPEELKKLKEYMFRPTIAKYGSSLSNMMKTGPQ